MTGRILFVGLKEEAVGYVGEVVEHIQAVVHEVGDT